MARVDSSTVDVLSVTEARAFEEQVLGVKRNDIATLEF
jgi:hypothetical protein